MGFFIIIIIMTKIKVSELQKIINLDEDINNQVKVRGLWALQPQSVSDMKEDLTYNHVSDATQDEYTMGGESITEDYPESFNHEEFKKLNSYAARKRYCEEHLSRLGSGSARIVYEIDNETVLKLAKNKKGLAQNNDEINISISNWHEDIVTKVHEYDHDSFWIRCEKAIRITKSRFKDLVEYSFDDIASFINDYGYRRKGQRSPFGQRVTPEMIDELQELEFITDILSVVDNWNIAVGDFERISSYGEVVRNGKSQVVLTDYGLTSGTYSTHYTREFVENQTDNIILESVENINPDTSQHLANYVAKINGLSEPQLMENGSGEWGHAYKSGNKVIKITSDSSEANNSEKIKGKKNKNIADIYDVLKVENLPNNEDGVYVIILELLDTNPNLVKEKINNLSDFFSSEIGVSFDEVFVYEVGSSSWSETYEIIEEAFIEKNEIDLKNFFHSILDINNELKSNNIDSMDFLNYLNLGYKNGNLAFFDLGGANNTSENSESTTNLLENKQKFEKEFVKKGYVNDEDIKNILDITGGDETTWLVADGYSKLRSIKPNDWGSERPYDKYIKDELVRYSKFIKDYKNTKNLFPIKDFDPINVNMGKYDFFDINGALKARQSAIVIFKRIPEKYRRNIKGIYREPLTMDEFRYHENVAGDSIRTLSAFLGRVSEMQNEKKATILMNKVFSSKNDTMKKVLHHIENSRPTYLNHDNEMKGFLEMVEYEEEYNEAKLLYKSESVVVVDIKSSDAMKSLGCGSQWCFTTETGGSSHWENYAEDSHVNMVINFDEEPDSYDRMVVVLPTGGVYNMYNEYIEDGYDYIEDLGVIQYINVMESVEEKIESNRVLDESIVLLERLLSWMPKAQAVSVKKECTLGGNGDGTSKACNQGDMDAIRLEDIKDENYKKPNEPNVAEDELKDRHYFKGIEGFISEEVLPYSDEDHEEDENRLDSYEIYDQAITIARDNNIRIGNNKELVGYIIEGTAVVGGLFESVSNEEYSFDVVIDRNFQRKGYGRELVEYALDQFNYYKDIYGDDLKLDVYVVNPNMRDLLKKYFNFNDLEKTGDDRYRMTKEGLHEGLNTSPLNELLVKNESIPPFIIKDNRLYLNGIEVGDIFISQKQFGDDKYMDLSEIQIHPDQRGNHIFTRFMNALAKYTDKNNIILSLTPEAKEGGGLTTNQLIDKYRKIGFVRNTASNSDFRVSNSWIRYPKNNNISESTNTGKVEFGCLMLGLKIPMWDKLINRIEENDLYDDGSDTFGREDEMHITILYGYHNNVSADDVFGVLGDIEENISVNATGISLFENKEMGFDVVKIDIEPSEGLIKLRKSAESETLDKTLTYNDYNPHMTMAYVKSGEGKKYVVEFKEPISLNVSTIYYSNKDNEKKIIQLNGSDKES